MKFTGFAAVLFLVAGMFGCTGSETNPSQQGLSSEYLLSSEPSGGRDVASIKESGQDGDKVVLVGKIAGSAEPFVEGIAAFTLVDLAVPHCPPEEGCPTPWDCCCHPDEARQKQALVQVVDADGKPLETDARKLLGVEGLSEVVVQGKLERDDQGNVTVLAQKVFVRK